MIHHPSGARGESREERSQLQNKRAAFLRMVATPKFKVWMAFELGHIAMVEMDMVIPPEQVKIEVKHNGRWVQVSEADLMS